VESGRQLSPAPQP
jgi:hypothetical protein